MDSKEIESKVKEIGKKVAEVSKSAFDKASDKVQDFTDKSILKIDIKKLQVKLDLPYKPEFITRKVIEDCMAFGDDRVRDLIVDKKIESVPSGFINYLFKGGNNRNFYGTRRKIQNYWTRYNKLQDQVNTLTMLCARYWKGSSDASKGGSDIQISPGINAINLQSLTNKIQIPQSVAYNQSMTDLICIGA